MVGTQPRVECSDLCSAETARLQFSTTGVRSLLALFVVVFAVCVAGISGLVVEYIVAIDVTRVRFPADAYTLLAE